MFCAYTRPRYQLSFYRTIGPLVIISIVYPCSGVRRYVSSRGRRRRQQFQTSSPPKPHGKSKPNFMWRLIGMGEQMFVETVQVT